MIDVSARAAGLQLHVGFALADLLRCLLIVLCKKRLVRVLKMAIRLFNVGIPVRLVHQPVAFEIGTVGRCKHSIEPLRFDRPFTVQIGGQCA